MTMNDTLTEHDLTALAHARLIWNTPLSLPHADDLITLLPVGGGDTIVDLGCGWGELLLRALLAYPDATGRGIDLSPHNIQRALARADELGVQSRVHFEVADMSAWDGHGDVIISIGAAHAWGTTSQALTALGRHGSHLLFGGGYWVSPPPPALVEMIGEDYADLGGLVEVAVARGYRPLHVSVADAREWDSFETGWCAGLEAWALDHPETPGARQARELADQHRREYFYGYRGVLGFGYLLLVR